MKPLSPNTLLQNRYLIVHLIGRGGMGEVYLAIDQRLGSAVALKRTSFSDDALLGSAFEREAKTLARLRHSALPKVSDHFIEDDNQYLIMEFIAGDDLAKRLETLQKPFPLPWVMFWADGLLDALNYLHSNEPPIIHRDIKPQNLKLTEENSIVLLDFGLSKNTLDAVSQFSATTTGSSVVGYTPHYAPLEQVRGTGTNARSDIYSLSATLYQLLTNIIPPDALTRAEAILGEMPDPLQPINESNTEVSPAISEIILKGMEISRDKRFASARQMQAALRDAHSKKPNDASSSMKISSGDSVGFPSQPLLPVNEIYQSQSSGRVSTTPATRIDSASADKNRITQKSTETVKDFPMRITKDAAKASVFATYAPTENHLPNNFHSTETRAPNKFSSDENQTANNENGLPAKQKSSLDNKFIRAAPKNNRGRKSLFVTAGVGSFFLLIATITAAMILLKSPSATDKSATAAMPETAVENTSNNNAAVPTTIIEASAKANVETTSASGNSTISNANSSRETAEKPVEKSIAGDDKLKALQPSPVKINPKPTPQIAASAPKQSIKDAAPKPKAMPTLLPRILP